MKKQYAIVFEATGIGGVINLHPFTETRYDTYVEAEHAIENLLSGDGALAKKKFYILPCYSK